MSFFAGSSALFGLCVALGIGLLIGAERERRKGRGATRAAAGIRTFAVAALLGAVSELLGGGALLAVAALVVGVLAAVAYLRSRERDPGMTTEISLLLTCLLGGLAIHEAAVAAGVGSALATLLAARNRIHHFVRGVLTERELHDALLFSAAVLIALPLAPDRFMGPFDAINPYALVRLVVLVMAISALGYVATRALGPRHGLPLAGFISGFVSSTATIHAMGERATKRPAQMKGAVAGAVLSSIATIVQMAVVIALVQPALLKALFLPLAFGGVAVCAYALLMLTRTLPDSDAQQKEELGRAFDLKAALAFAALVSAVLLLSAGLNDWLGSRGTLLAAALTGLADAHATAASVASLVAANKMSSEAALWPILLGLTSNSVMKAVVAYRSGGAPFARRIVPGLLMLIGAIWLGVWLGVWLG